MSVTVRDMLRQLAEAGIPRFQLSQLAMAPLADPDASSSSSSGSSSSSSPTAASKQRIRDALSRDKAGKADAKGAGEARGDKADKGGGKTKDEDEAKERERARSGSSSNDEDEIKHRPQVVRHRETGQGFFGKALRLTGKHLPRTVRAVQIYLALLPPHPNIVSLRAFAREGTDYLWLLLDLVDGPHLGKRPLPTRPDPPRERDTSSSPRPVQDTTPTPAADTVQASTASSPSVVSPVPPEATTASSSSLGSSLETQSPATAHEPVADSPTQAKAAGGKEEKKEERKRSRKDRRRADKHKGPMSEELMRSLLGQFALAIAVMHERGLVHLDVKPRNCLLDVASWRVMLCDFDGCAFEGQLWDPEDRDKLIFHFTRCYAAPEMVRRVSLRKRRARDGKRDGGQFRLCRELDLWSLGISLFRITQGRLPFRLYRLPLDTSRDHREMFARIRDGAQGIAPDEWRPSRTFPGLRSLIGSLLVADPSRRVSARSIADALLSPSTPIIPRS